MFRFQLLDGADISNIDCDFLMSPFPTTDALTSHQNMFDISMGTPISASPAACARNQQATNALHVNASAPINASSCAGSQQAPAQSFNVDTSAPINASSCAGSQQAAGATGYNSTSTSPSSNNDSGFASPTAKHATDTSASHTQQAQMVSYASNAQYPSTPHIPKSSSMAPPPMLPCKQMANQFATQYPNNYGAGSVAPAPFPNPAPYQMHEYRSSAQLHAEISQLYARFAQSPTPEVNRLFHSYLSYASDMEVARLYQVLSSPAHASYINAEHERKHSALIRSMYPYLDQLKHGIPLTNLPPIDMNKADSVAGVYHRLRSLCDPISAAASSSTATASPVASASSLNVAPIVKAEGASANVAGAAGALLPPPHAQAAPVHRTASSRFSSKFSEEAQSILTKWYTENVTHPYPGRHCVVRLADECGMTKSQVQRWFSNRRARDKNTRSMGEIARLRQGKINGVGNSDHHD